MATSSYRPPWLTWQSRISWCSECHKNTCKMDPFLKNCKKNIRNWIIGLKFFPLESENNLLHVKKITVLPTVSFFLYILKMESFLYSLSPRQMRKKVAKWAGKCSENDVLNNMLKPHDNHVFVANVTFGYEQGNIGNLRCMFLVY